jgi:carbamoylphosphate synthase large subunit
MNVLYLSPAFPPTARFFCAALRARGVRVLGIGDEPWPAHGEYVDDYVFEPNMADSAALQRAAQSLRGRHGDFDRVDSNGEHWLDAEARLRESFSVYGLQPSVLARQRSKLGMAQLFAQAGIPHPPGIRANDPERVREFARQQGFPLVLKPDVGSGAMHTFSVATPAELETALRSPLDHHLIQPFIAGDIVTYDGLTDREGRIVFATSHRYDVGIMQIRQARRDGFYYSLREIPRALEEYGARAVRAFDVRERFFHLEFFEKADGSYVALEMNLRPPGGFTTDMMNHAFDSDFDFDVYSLWAAVLSGESLADFTCHPKYHTAHAGRRDDRHYRLSHSELSAELGTTLVECCPVPKAFADTMGDTAYLLRHPDLSALLEAIELVQRVAAEP